MTGNESVHLQDWPEAGRINELVVIEMNLLRDYVNQGLSIRAKEGLKVRQPIAGVTITSNGEFIDFTDILKEELNVKEVRIGKSFDIDLTLTPELISEGLMREVIRHIQATRKEAELNVDDRIKLALITDSKDLLNSIDEHQKTIQAETLAIELHNESIEGFIKSVNIDDYNLEINCL